jgi:two-component sensor histidine kinase
LKEYLTDLVDNLVASYSLNSDRIHSELNIDNILLGLEAAIPCGLIINEIVVNSLKYAFSDGRPGLISISVHKPAPDTIEMKIGDNGIGLPENVKINTSRTLGMELIHALVEQQLGGKIELNRRNGTEYTVVFKTNVPGEIENARK